MNTSMLISSEEDSYCLFIPKKTKPLSYSELVDTHINKTNTYEMVFDAEILRTRESSKNPPVDNQRTVLASITFNRAVPIYALVEGGWLPPPFVIPSKLLFDRNVIGHIEQITKGNTRSIYQETDWWLQLLNDPKLVANPFLFAFEGSQQKPPTLNEFKHSFEEASLLIKNLLPKAQVPIYDNSIFERIIKEVSNILKDHQQETKFLINTIPLIREAVAVKQLPIMQSEILKIAQDLGLSIKSLAVLAVLSCLYENFRVAKFNTAREVLHIKKGEYTIEKAYNALSDLRALSLYLTFLAIDKKENHLSPFAFCSSDRAVILFGCGLEFHNVKFVGKTVNAEFNITPHLFPRLPKAGRIELAQQLSI